MTNYAPFLQNSVATPVHTVKGVLPFSDVSFTGCLVLGFRCFILKCLSVLIVMQLMTIRITLSESIHSSVQFLIFCNYFESGRGDVSILRFNFIYFLIVNLCTCIYLNKIFIMNSVWALFSCF